MPSPQDLKTWRQFAEKLAVKVGRFIKSHQNQAKVYQFKDAQDIATDIDIAAETQIIAAVSRQFPRHNIHSEEKGFLDHQSDFTWFIDPIDCTKEYFRGLPTYGVLMACQSQNQILVGCVYIPATGELYSASLNQGAYQNGQKIRVSPQNQLNQSIVSAHLPSIRLSPDELPPAWQKLADLSSHLYRLRGTNFDSLALSWLAKGALEAYLLLFGRGPNWWDVAAGLLIAQEAGAKITDRFGKPLNYSHYKLNHGLIASNGKIHSQLLHILNS